VQKSYSEKRDEKLQDYRERNVPVQNRKGGRIRPKCRKGDRELRNHSSVAKISQRTAKKHTQDIADPADEDDGCGGRQGNAGKAHEGDGVGSANDRIHQLERRDGGKKKDGNGVIRKST